MLRCVLVVYVLVVCSRGAGATILDRQELMLDGLAYQRQEPAAMAERYAVELDEFLEDYTLGHVEAAVFTCNLEDPNERVTPENWQSVNHVVIDIFKLEDSKAAEALRRNPDFKWVQKRQVDAVTSVADQDVSSVKFAFGHYCFRVRGYWPKDGNGRANLYSISSELADVLYPQHDLQAIELDGFVFEVPSSPYVGRLYYGYGDQRICYAHDLGPQLIESKSGRDYTYLSNLALSITDCESPEGTKQVFDRHQMSSAVGPPTSTELIGDETAVWSSSIVFRLNQYCVSLRLNGRFDDPHAILFPAAVEVANYLDPEGNHADPRLWIGDLCFYPAGQPKYALPQQLPGDQVRRYWYYLEPYTVQTETGGGIVMNDRIYLELADYPTEAAAKVGFVQAVDVRAGRIALSIDEQEFVGDVSAGEKTVLLRVGNACAYLSHCGDAAHHAAEFQQVTRAVVDYLADLEASAK